MNKSWQQLMAKSQEQLASGKLDDAQNNALQALAMSESLPPDDRRQGMSLELLTGILFRKKQYGLSEPFMRRLLEMYKRCLGAEHLDTGTVFHNVALLYHGWGKLEDADAYYLKAVKVKSKHLPAEHPDMVVLTGNYAALRSVLVPLEQAMRPRLPIEDVSKNDTLSLTGQYNVASVPDGEFGVTTKK
ncbi:MAG: tetratricopeptide repeat protein [Candidatus Melainabacteria bacterium]|nr:tetratricopeptide repeat protein [Candidatus Melainabacteria bacterium]